jgi:elongation factor P--(R)-beta-lysine ligase
MVWWQKNKLQDNLPILLARGKVKRILRDWFDAQNFIEVETSQLQISPGNEVHLLGLSTQWTSPMLESRELFFATSPEFACKKLIAGGMTQIYEFARVFRNRDLSALHTPEFTMLEWYRTNQDWNKVIADTIEICKLAANSINAKSFRNKDFEIDINIPPQRLTLQQAFLQFANIDMLSTLDEAGKPKRDEFAKLAINIGINIDDNDNWSDIFTKVLVAKIEPNLGVNSPTILCEYPLPEGALAQKCKHDCRVVERFELYICNIEIANGFGELIDAQEQKSRFESSMQEQKQIYGKAFPIDYDLIDAISHMPPTSGVALGLERLLMLITGAPKINDVLWTPFE